MKHKRECIIDVHTASNDKRVYRIQLSNTPCVVDIEAVYHNHDIHFTSDTGLVASVAIELFWNVIR